MLMPQNCIRIECAVETRIGRRQVLRMLAMGAAAAGLGFSRSPRHRSLALITNSNGNDINVIDLERLALAGDWQVGEHPMASRYRRTDGLRTRPSRARKL